MKQIPESMQTAAINHFNDVHLESKNGVECFSFTSFLRCNKIGNTVAIEITSVMRDLETNK